MSNPDPRVIRPYRPSDRAAVLDVWTAASAQAHPFLSQAFLEAERRNIAEVHLPAADAWVWAAGENVLGFIAMVGNEIGGLFVHPDHQGRGIGRALVDHVRDAHDPLEVEVFRQNRLGRAFYAAYGFVEESDGVHPDTGLEILRLSLPRGVRPPPSGRIGQ